MSNKALANPSHRMHYIKDRFAKECDADTKVLRSLRRRLDLASDRQRRWKTTARGMSHLVVAWLWMIWSILLGVVMVSARCLDGRGLRVTDTDCQKPRHGHYRETGRIPPTYKRTPPNELASMITKYHLANSYHSQAATLAQDATLERTRQFKIHRSLPPWCDKLDFQCEAAMYIADALKLASVSRWFAISVLDVAKSQKKAPRIFVERGEWLWKRSREYRNPDKYLGHCHRWLYQQLFYEHEKGIPESMTKDVKSVIKWLEHECGFLHQ